MSTSPPTATQPTFNLWHKSALCKVLIATLVQTTYKEGEQTLAPLFPVAEAEADPEVLLAVLVLTPALVLEDSTLAIELLAAAAASADDSATNA